MKTIQRMYEHLHWANLHIFDALQNIKGDKQEVCGLFSHILSAEKVWFTRLQGIDGSQIPLWPEMNMVQCAELIMQNEMTITTYLTNLKESDLDQSLLYKNSKGTEFTNSVRDILTHVAMHGQYHRGQINTRLRANGEVPVNVDFITFVR
ncbi:hypothetical protein M670_03502 [Schinkia azotoformans MEV2011]|uniref:Damage-inducible protein DinB n=1 Tax=Schinkia azotoformans MEV2011 TaxID=1348973 RepID=A0A072NIC5_SCHAZ|nr:DinB family protein [Schinkia azotoformans]KEF37256.1 hypothetical protein M670_03502 [Schinkia azotoformans MEV2011]MEC1697360.1 DinB family protein [Schinkia azotoformans]MEC1714591.1 DinB family protein [Schinkia azotoformans]MEC1724358.1 DinB family protein [Schinkia azotoformans]MEC1742958.1 DinB family protein [Schinkia azotoformans]